MSACKVSDDYLDHGFVALVEVMGSDNAIEDAARVSYGAGTRKTSETRGLIRYLMKHRHTSPFEMGVLRFHLKMPIFVMRQHVRHRTASLNEYSLRYSEALDECYVPAEESLAKQSGTNKQGREGAYCGDDAQDIRTHISLQNESAVRTYRLLRNEEEYGLSRELARSVLPVSNYTECFWQINLHNFMHYLKLRLDSHAQKEIRDMAGLMYKQAREYFPLSFEAFDDYVLHAKTFSRMELKALKLAMEAPLLGECGDAAASVLDPLGNDSMGMSEREWTEFLGWINDGD